MATSDNLYSVIQGLAPLLYYPLTETSGTTLVNAGSLGSACNLTLTGSYTLANRQLITGDSTNFLKLTGGYATGSKGAMPLPLTNMTLSVVLEIFPSTPLATNPRFFAITSTSELESGNAQALYGFTASTLTPESFHENDVGVNNSVGSTQNMALAAKTGIGNTRVHFTVIRDANSKEVRFYYNGGLLSSGTYAANPTGGTITTMWLGSEQDNRPSHPMTMGHLCLWDRVLTETEMSDLHTASGYNSYPGVGYYGLSIQSQDQINWGTLESTKDLLSTSALKRLKIAYDALIDPGINNPQEVYSEN